MKATLYLADALGMPGVMVWDLPWIDDDRGWVQLLGAPEMGGPLVIGEVYASNVYRDYVKAWHLHKRMTLRYVCVSGAVDLGLYDSRFARADGTGFKSGKIRLRSQGEWYRAVTIPPGIWNGFRLPVTLTDDHATIVNCPDLVHDPSEIIRVPPNTFPFDWGPYKGGG